MRYLASFKDFKNPINEIIYTDHWKKRTAYKNEIGSSISRIVPLSTEFKNGFELLQFIDKNGEEIPKKEGLDILEINETAANYYITFCLRALTRSEKLSEWKSNSNAFYLMLGLGRIRFYRDSYGTFYPSIGGTGDAGTPYQDGDMIWGMVKENVKGITIKYYPSGDFGLRMMLDDSNSEALRSIYSNEDPDIIIPEFRKNSYINYPYGKDFEIIVNLNLDNRELILEDIKSQLGIKDL